ncbi:MAG: YybH family protein [Candidatus Heimdallarchaeota archaeon]
MDEAQERDINAVKEVLNQFAIGLNSGNLDHWMSIWADNAVQMPPDTPSRIGKNYIRERSQGTFERMNFEIKIDLKETKVYGDLGITRCNYTLKLIPKDGGETINAVPDGKALTLYKRQSDSSWKIIYDCFNSNVPPT